MIAPTPNITQPAAVLTKRLLLSVEHLTIVLNGPQGPLTVVDNLSFNLHEGEVLGIVGESGSGKSVTATAILGLWIGHEVAHIEGNVWYYLSNGEKINLLAMQERQLLKYRGKEISIVFQEPLTALNPLKTCGQQVQEALLRHKNISKSAAKTAVLELLKKIPFSSPERIYNAYPHQISGGQKQRILVAIAMINEPRLLIADEPTTALDTIIQQKIIQLFQKLNHDFATAMLFISHDLGVVSQLADQVLVLNHGKVQEHNPSAILFSDPQSAYTKGLLACRPRLDVKLHRMPTLADFIPTDDQAVRYQNVEEAIEDQRISATDLTDKRRAFHRRTPILQVEGLSYSYKSEKRFPWSKSKVFPALREVTFNIYEGEILGLVGQSGSGKSTLARVINHLLTGAEGKLSFHGQNILAFDKKEVKSLRQEISMIFQDPFQSLNPRHTIAHCLTEPLKTFGIGHSHAERLNTAKHWITKVGLPEDALHRYPHAFSGGQRQRIAIARALITHPKLIICDECVSALDVSVQAQILNLILDLRDELKISFLFISHDLSVIKAVADRVCVMNRGVIVEQDFVDTLFDKPKHQYTQALLEAIPDIKSAKKIDL